METRHYSIRSGAIIRRRIFHATPDSKPSAPNRAADGWQFSRRSLSAWRARGDRGAPTEIGTRTLRKTFARLIYSALNHDLVRTSYAMRHASVATTVKYLSFREEDVDLAILNL